jgi:hypothetical protein
VLAGCPSFCHGACAASSPSVTSASTRLRGTVSRAAGNLRTFALPVVFPAATCTLLSRSRIIGEYAPRTNRARSLRRGRPF